MKNSRNWDEVCYPFIHETSHLCDFEVVTDELCALIGSALSAMPETMNDIKHDLQIIQPLAFHINGSIRGKLAVQDDDQRWLLERLAYYRELVGERQDIFILPRGSGPIAHLHQARSAAKKAIRCMVRVEQEGRLIPEILPRMCNTLCNLFFLMTLAINVRTGVAEVPFASKSYGASITPT